MCIYGGRNDEIIKDGFNPMLNDINLYDFCKIILVYNLIGNNHWITVVVYGSSLRGKTLHMMGSVGKDKLMIFGGNDLKTFCESTTLSFLDFSNTFDYY